MHVCKIIEDGVGCHILGRRVEQNNWILKINMVINFHEFITTKGVPICQVISLDFE
jgi:hypothetical protein